jgi:hypothetical protein
VKPGRRVPIRLGLGDAVVQPGARRQRVVTIADQAVQQPLRVHMRQIVVQVRRRLRPQQQRAVHNRPRVIVRALGMSVLHCLKSVTEAAVCCIHPHVQHPSMNADIPVNRSPHAAQPENDVPHAHRCHPPPSHHGHATGRRRTVVQPRRPTGGTAGKYHNQQEKERWRCAHFLSLLPVCLLAIGVPAAAMADGTRPGQPYRYLHPPKYAQDLNQRPLGAVRTLTVKSVAGGRLWFAFTHDGQAGLSSTGTPFAAPPGTTAFRIALKPVETPAGLPDTLYADGDAYTIAVTAEPEGNPVSIKRHVTLTLRWPRLPHAVYLYSGGNWSQLCSLRQSTYTPVTIACPTTKLGTFVAVVVGPARPHASLWQRVRGDLWLWLLVAALIVVAVVVAMVALVRSGRTRRHRG